MITNEEINHTVTCRGKPIIMICIIIMIKPEIRDRLLII